MAPPLRGFSIVEDSDDSIVYVARKDFTDSDKPLRFAVKVMYCEEWDSEWATNGKYHIEICAVGPEWCSEETLGRAAECCGMSMEEFGKVSEEWRCLTLIEYGTRAPLWQEQGNNLRKLLKAAREELARIQMLFGFYMDRPVNAIGDTGWDWIAGDIGAAMKRKE